MIWVCGGVKRKIVVHL